MAPHSFSFHRRILVLLTFAVVTTAFLPVSLVHADPPVTPRPPAPVIPPFIPPPVFCFRLTDIADVVGDPEGNAFIFEFEVLNWTNQPAFGLDLAQALAFTPITFGGQPTIIGNGIDPDGRTIGPGSDGANLSPADGTFMPAKFGAANGWTPGATSPTTANYFTLGAGIPNRDLLGVPPGPGPARTAAALALVPSDGVAPNFVDGFGRPNIGNFEAIDNGGPGVDGLPDNVLDGFLLEVDDFDLGETLSLNWFLNDALGVPIGTSSMGNAYGFGNFNLYRSTLGFGPADRLPALWRRQPDSPFGDGQNRGSGLPPGPTAAQFTSTSVPFGNIFAMEPGAALTAPFEDPADQCPTCDVNGDPLPQPQFVDVGLSGFQTIPGQTFINGFPGASGPAQFEGIPLGVPECPDCDMLVGRMDLLDPLLPGPQTIPIEIVELQLQSVDPIDLGFGPEHVFVFLNGPQIPGQMTVDFTLMTFDVQLPVQFEILGSISGTSIVDSINLQVQGAQFSSDDPSRISLPGFNEAFIPIPFGLEGVTGGGLNILHTLDVPPPPIIEGDYNCDGIVGQADLNMVLLNWGGGTFPGKEEALPGGGPFDGNMSQNELNAVLLNWGNSFPLAASTTIPEPSSFLLLVGLAGLGLTTRRK